MNYRRIYNELIMRGWRRTNLDGYCEKHHIIPKCIGGGNEVSNLVKLTAEEHFIAHLLLTRMYPEDLKLASAIFLMSHRKNMRAINNNKIYSKFKEAYSKSVSDREKGIPRTKEERESIRKGSLGKKLTEATKSKISATKRGNSPSPMKGKSHSVEARLKISIANKGRTSPRKGKILSKEAKDHLSRINTGKTLSQETKDKISNTLKGREAPWASKPLSDETKAKIAAANLGSHRSEETKAKLSAKAKARLPITAETKLKMSKSARNKPPITEETRLKMSIANKANAKKRKDKKEILQFWCAL